MSDVDKRSTHTDVLDTLGMKWDHIEIISGHKIPARERASYFSCSC